MEQDSEIAFRDSNTPLKHKTIFSNGIWFPFSRWGVIKKKKPERV